MLKTQKILRASLFIGLVMMIFQIGIAASTNSGKTKKKVMAKKSFFYNGSSRLNVFTSSNGYILKGAIQNQKLTTDNVMIQLRTLYFQKGNEVYVLPVKPNVILSKFSAPRKQLF